MCVSWILSKGYCCYHPPSRKMFITADITFSKNHSYFPRETHYQNQSLNPNLPIPLPIFSQSRKQFTIPPTIHIVYTRRGKQSTDHNFRSPHMVYIRRSKVSPDVVAVTTSPISHMVSFHLSQLCLLLF